MFRTAYGNNSACRYLLYNWHYARILPLLIVATMLAGCRPTQQSREPLPTQDSSGLSEILRAFPQERPPVDGERIRYTSAVWGTLVLENGCLQLITAEDFTDRVESYLIIWPDDYWPGIEDSSGDVVVYDGSGEIAARVGQPLYMGGAEIPGTKPISEIPLALSSGLQEPTPPECPGPYWLAGSIEMQNGPPAD